MCGGERVLAAEAPAAADGQRAEDSDGNLYSDRGSGEECAKRLLVAVLSYEAETLSMAEVKCAIGRSCVEELASDRLVALAESVRSAAGRVAAVRLADVWGFGASG